MTSYSVSGFGSKHKSRPDQAVGGPFPAVARWWDRHLEPAVRSHPRTASGQNRWLWKALERCAGGQELG